MVGRRKLTIVIGVILVLIVGCLAGYFGYYVKTPQYSLNIIRTAVDKHDWETFSKHVDTEQVVTSAFDGFVGYAMDKESDDTVKAFAGGFIAIMKPSVVKEMTNSIKKYVETGNKKSDENGSSTMAGLDEQADVNNVEFKGIAYSNKNNNLATVGIKIYDKELKQEFVIDLKMRELSDGTWQVIEVPNFKEYLADVEKAKNKS
jgi:hypothetical protein